MKVRREENNLVKVKSNIHSKYELFHHLVTQLEKIDDGILKVTTWCDEIDKTTMHLPKKGSLKALIEEKNRSVIKYHGENVFERKQCFIILSDVIWIRQV